jgi:hypothetical protein
MNIGCARVSTQNHEFLERILPALQIGSEVSHLLPDL